MKIAISGTGVAGPTFAFWLKRYGFTPVLLEKAQAPRKGGYIVDFWGSGFTVAERMGLVPAFERDGYRFKRLRTVTASGQTTTSVPLERFSDMVGGRYISIARSDIARRVLEACEGIATRFATSIAAIDEAGDGLDLSFENSTTERFDLLVGADGLHSNTRRQVFGADAEFTRPMGLRVSAFTLAGYRPREEGDYVMFTRPDRQVARATLRNDRTLFLFVSNERLAPDPDGPPREMLRDVFGGMGWEVDSILARLEEADDFYSDAIAQIRMSRWSLGRVALVGDAAGCISLLGGEGTGLAMTGAYVLAGELAKAGGDHRTAFAAYEAKMRPLIESKQENAMKFRNFFAPPSWPTLFVRDGLNLLTAIPGLGDWIVRRSFTDGFDLPDYSALERAEGES